MIARSKDRNAESLRTEFFFEHFLCALCGSAFQNFVLLRTWLHPHAPSLRPKRWGNEPAKRRK